MTTINAHPRHTPGAPRSPDPDAASQKNQRQPRSIEFDSAPQSAIDFGSPQALRSGTAGVAPAATRAHSSSAVSRSGSSTDASEAPSDSSLTYPENPFSWNLSPAQQSFHDNMIADSKSGGLTPDGMKLANAVLAPGSSQFPGVQVSTFAVDGIQANDAMVIHAARGNPDGPNALLYMPEKEGASFHEFKNKDDMNSWLKGVAADPERLDKFASHFSNGVFPERTARVKQTMTRYGENDVNAVVGPFGYEGNNIFKRLDNKTAPPVAVNGLSDLQRQVETPEGRTTYSGKRPDGERVLYQYDAYGNLQGEGDKGNFYFVKNGLNNHDPLSPLSPKEFRNKIEKESFNNVGGNDIRGLYDEFIKQLENPANGLGDALQVFGVDENTANTVERYLDNPLGAALVDLNKDNQIGAALGLDKATADKNLKLTGNVAQGFVPVYGQARAMGQLVAMGLRNEPMDEQQTRDLANALAIKPESVATKNPPGFSPHMQNRTGKPFTPDTAANDNVTPPEEPKIAGSPAVSHHPGMRQIEFEGNAYFVSERPDAGDGQHYILRVEHPNDSSKLVSSSKIGAPDEAGVWHRRGVKGGGNDAPGAAQDAAQRPFGGTPISEGDPISLGYQKPATPGQILELGQYKGRYTFRSQDPSDNKPFTSRDDHAFAYVIRAEEPDKVYLGSLNKSMTADGKKYPFASRDNEELVDGHSALTHGLKDLKGGGTDVYYAGTVFFRDGKPMFWTNDSGHYTPEAALRHKNLTPEVKKLLPDELFVEGGRETPEQQKAWERSTRLTAEEEWESRSHMRDKYGAQASDSDMSDDDFNDAYVAQLRKKTR